jgi:glycosyltransferase involved in cell wall biosynthesis
MADFSSKHAPYYPDIKHFINIFLSENIRMNIITLDNKFKSNSPNVNVFYIKKFQNANTLLNHLFIQIYLSYVLYKIRRQSKYNFFHVGGTQCILPQITAKLLGQFNFTFILGSTEIGMKFDLSYSRFSLDKICRYIELCLIELSEYITLTITNRLIFLSKSLIHFTKLERYNNKSYFINLNYIDNFFTRRKTINNRSILISYIGRNCKLKGVDLFIHSIPYILNVYPDGKFLIIGDGNFFSESKELIKKYKIEKNVVIKNNIDHSKISDVLNESKFLILLSYSEGLPKIILEAMACGTPVLTTPVGAIPDIIKECETGFLLKSYNPKHIAMKIIELLNKPDLLEKVSVNATKYVQENFSYEKTMESWQKIFGNLD